MKSTQKFLPAKFKLWQFVVLVEGSISFRISNGAFTMQMWKDKKEGRGTGNEK